MWRLVRSQTTIRKQDGQIGFNKMIDNNPKIIMLRRLPKRARQAWKWGLADFSQKYFVYTLCRLMQFVNVPASSSVLRPCSGYQSFGGHLRLIFNTILVTFQYLCQQHRIKSWQTKVIYGKPYPWAFIGKKIGSTQRSAPTILVTTQTAQLVICVTVILLSNSAGGTRKYPSNQL